MTLPSLAREFLSLEQLAVLGADLSQVFLMLAAWHML